MRGLRQAQLTEGSLHTGCIALCLSSSKEATPPLDRRSRWRGCVELFWVVETEGQTDPEEPACEQ